MYDTCTVFGCHIVTEDYTECAFFHLHELLFSVLAVEHLFRMCSYIVLDESRSIFVNLCSRLHPWHQLLVVHTLKFATCVFAYYSVRNNLVTMLVFFHRRVFAFLLEVCAEQRFCNDYSQLLVVIRIVCLYGKILYRWTNT